MKRMVIVILCVFSMNAYAQNNMRWSLNVGSSFPLGNYANMDYDGTNLTSDWALFEEDTKCGGASTGINWGIEALIPLQDERFSITIIGDFHIAHLNATAKSYLAAVGQGLVNTIVQQTINAGASQARAECTRTKEPSYINLPIMAGVRYTIPFSNGMSCYADGGIGYNFKRISPLELKIKSDYVYGGIMYNTTEKLTLSYSTNNSFAFRLGGGLNFRNNISISAYYYYLGGADVSSHVRMEDSDGGVQTQTYHSGTITPMMFVLKIGYTF